MPTLVHIVVKPSVLENKPAAFVEHLQIKGERMCLNNHAHSKGK